jgi:hypothetical protein
MNVFIHKNDHQMGPFSHEQIYEMLDRGEITPSDLAWTEGLCGWQALSSLLAPREKSTPSHRSPSKRLTYRQDLIILAAAVVGAIISHHFDSMAAPDASSYIAQIVGGTLLLFVLAVLVAWLVKGGAIAGVVIVAVLTYVISSQANHDRKTQRDDIKAIRTQEQDGHANNP